ncbi:isopenicillin N synthase family oxygenase [Oleomonas cavernae]|uniref:2-oxoglutarate-dependent ethylene/succinate-forming enzyme n=1 Tax=Oleomonas cavernae TaxID=2320859 RepID=A0A418WCG9_9PROT|nr:2-oxoglutarate and iron-dependent oxygenase domain-containing protein [Oleomonas cavernae]RJF87733.1 isopenicillin N synthase family oxygenase [Oleomonas cavernae]
MALIQTGNGARAMASTGLSAQTVPFTEIPIIDFAPMAGGGDAAREAVGLAVREACIKVGFFYARNSGVSPATVAETYRAARNFFALPLATKQAIHIGQSTNHRGYVPLLEENTDPTARGDLHEAFDMALEVPADDADVLAGQSLYGPNVWPDGPPGFRAAMNAYYAEIYQFGRKIFRAFAIALDLGEYYFEPHITKPTAQLRVLHYPSQDGPVDDRQIGIGAHSDYECFTILSQEDVPALQLLNSAGQWVHAPPIPDTFIVNVGDMMARWTNDIFKSTVHRAINRSGRERYSIPFFFGPNFTTPVEVFPTCAGPGNPAKYPPTTAGQYILSRFDETFAYRKKPAEPA